MDQGLPSFYITINPADVFNPLVKFLAGSEIDIDNLLPEEVPDYWEQAILVAKNPAIAANFFQHLNALAKQCQSHTHSGTCLRCLDLDRMVNNFNATILEAVRCNMDIKFIGSGASAASAKAILYYITDYVTKFQLKAHVAYAALELAVNKLGEYDPQEDDFTYRAKRLLQKCAYAMISHQEFSTQQVCSYLMDYEDHFTSHKFRNLYWTSFKKWLNDEDPAPECYSTSNTATTSTENPPADNEQDIANENLYNELAESPDEHLDDSYESGDTDINSDEEISVAVQSNGELIAEQNLLKMTMRLTH